MDAARGRYAARTATAAVLEQRRASGVRGDRRSGFVTLVSFSVLTSVPRIGIMGTIAGCPAPHAPGGIGAEERKMTNTIPADLIKALPHGVSVEDCTITTVAELGSEYDIDIADDIDAGIGAAPALLLPGWFANDGHAEIYIPDADSGEAAARQYVDTGDWGERHRTEWIDVWAWRRARSEERRVGRGGRARG